MTAERFGYPVRVRIDVQGHRLEVAIAPLEGLPLAQTIAAQHAQDQAHRIVAQTQSHHAGAELLEVIGLGGNLMRRDAGVGLRA